MPRPIYTLLAGALVLTMCKKESIGESPVVQDPIPDRDLTAGLPEKPGTVHGYFFSTYNYYRDFNNAIYSTMSCFAQFCDPPSNLLISLDRNYRAYYSPIKPRSNIQMGNVSFNNNYLYNTSENLNPFYYGLSSYDNPAIDQRVYWSVSGNEIIPAFEQRIKDEFPLPKSLYANLWIDCKKNYAIRLADHFDRWDSIIVQIKGDSGSGDLLISNRCGADTILTFNQSDLDFFKNSSQARLTVKAFRFFHRTIAGRTYVFELGTSVEHMLTMTR